MIGMENSIAGCSQRKDLPVTLLCTNQEVNEIIGALTNDPIPYAPGSDEMCINTPL